MTDFVYLTENMFRPDVLADVGGSPRLIGTRCERCGDVRFPAAEACPRCHAAKEELVATALSEHGEVTTCCRIERAPKAFKAPYLVGYVQLPEGPRVLCQIESQSLEPREVIGKPCTLSVGPLFERDAVAVCGYKFKVSA